MSNKRFDATLNDLIEIAPGDWAACFGRIAGIPPGPSTALDTDLATTLQADKIFRIDGAQPSLLHLELAANPRLGIPRELLRYNTFVDQQHDLPVESVLILLRPKARASDQTGIYRRVGASGRTIAEFRYEVVRVWEKSIDFWLDGGISLTPLSMITDEANADLEGTLGRFRRIVEEFGADAKTTAELLQSSLVLCGLRYDGDRVTEMFQRLNMLMEDSTTYQLILKKGLEKGRAQEGRHLLMRLGTKKLGPASPEVEAVIQGIADPSRLESLMDRLLDAKSWDDLLKSE